MGVMNMAGMSEEEIRTYTARRRTGCLAAAAAAAAAAVGGFAWAVYLACGIWPGLAIALPQAGMILTGASAALTGVAYAAWRLNHAGC